MAIHAKAQAAAPEKYAVRRVVIAADRTAYSRQAHCIQFQHNLPATDSKKLWVRKNNWGKSIHDSTISLFKELAFANEKNGKVSFA